MSAQPPYWRCTSRLATRYQSGWQAVEWGRRVFTSGGGGLGGSIEPPKLGGRGFRKRAQLTGTINQLL